MIYAASWLRLEQVTHSFGALSDYGTFYGPIQAPGGPLQELLHSQTRDPGQVYCAAAHFSLVVHLSILIVTTIHPPCFPRFASCFALWLLDPFGGAIILLLRPLVSGSIMRADTTTALFTFSLLVSESQVLAAYIKPRSFLAGNYNPAPSPQDGPPAAFGAVRDRKYLPAQVGGIVGAYALITIVICTILFIVSRRSRKSAEQARTEIELKTPTRLVTHQTHHLPLSPGSQNFQHGFDPKGPTPYVFPATQGWEQTSPISPVGNDPNVDPNVAQADRNNLQAGLEDIYAHVMEQEEAKLAGIKLTELPVPTPHWQPQPQPAPSSASTKTKTRNRPSNIEMGEKHSSRTSSLLSSIMSPRKKKEREMHISSPIPTPLRAGFAKEYASDEEPLSPRYNKPPPPIPTDQEPYYPSHSRAASGYTNDTDPSPISPVRSIASHLQPYNRSQDPERGHSYNQSQTSITTQGSRRGTPLLSNPSGSPRPLQGSGIPTSPRASRVPPTLNLRTSSSQQAPSPSQPSSTVGSTHRALPFRAFDPPPGLASPSLNSGFNLSSAATPATKTTVLERAAHPALLSPGLRTPWTAGAVPYSPYQPFSPLMPVTPHLVTKEDRKMERKREKKMGLKSPTLEMVGNENETWGDGY